MRAAFLKPQPGGDRSDHLPQGCGPPRLAECCQLRRLLSPTYSECSRSPRGDAEPSEPSLPQLAPSWPSEPLLCGHPPLAPCPGSGSHKPVSPSRTQLLELSVGHLVLHARVEEELCHPLPLRSASCLSAHPGGRAYRLPPGAGAPWTGSTAPPVASCAWRSGRPVQGTSPFSTACHSERELPEQGSVYPATAFSTSWSCSPSCPSHQASLDCLLHRQSLVGHDPQRARRHLGLQ